MPREDLLALAGEVALEEAVEELGEHRVVHAGGPVEAAEPAQLRVGDAPVDRLHGGGVPGVDVAVGEDDFRLGVGLDELPGESDAGPVAHGLGVAEELVPVGAGKGLALLVIFGGEGVHPHESVGGVLDGAVHHVVGVDVAELLHGSSHGWNSS